MEESNLFRSGQLREGDCQMEQSKGAACAIKQMDIMRVYSTKKYNILMIIFTEISIFAL